MAWRAMLFGAITLMTQTGCDPRVTLRVRQTSVPAPSFDCVEASLRGSPDISSVTRVAPEEGKEQLLFTARDYGQTRHARQLSLAQASPPASDQTLTLTSAWVGSRHPSEREEREVTALAGRLLDAIRAGCVPGAQVKVECMYADGRAVRECPVGG